MRPTASRGSFLEAAIQRWGAGVVYEGYELNEEYVASASERLERSGARIHQENFFEHDWHRCLRRPEFRRVLALGNPPWATNSEQGRLRGDSLPVKSNAAGCSGIAARTSKSNFDIAEWMIERLVEALPEGGAAAVLCKTMTATRVLRSLGRRGSGRRDVRLFRLDAKAAFDVSADACLFFVTGAVTAERPARVFETLGLRSRSSEFGYVDNTLSTTRMRTESTVRWGAHRHRTGGGQASSASATQVMESVRQGNAYANGRGESVQLEEDFVYPRLKSPDVGNGRVAAQACLGHAATHRRRHREIQRSRPADLGVPELPRIALRQQGEFGLSRSAAICDVRHRPLFVRSMEGRHLGVLRFVTFPACLPAAGGP